MYRKSQRYILLIIGLLFCVLAMVVLWFAQGQDLTYLLPVAVFGGVGSFSLFLAILGSDKAVAKMWGSNSSDKQIP